MPGSATRAIEIPDAVGDGPLRIWLEWLSDLRRRAGTPSLAEIAGRARKRGVAVSTATVRRLLRGESLSDGSAIAVAYVLAESDARPGPGRPSQDWDAFDKTLTYLLVAAQKEFSGVPPSPRVLPSSPPMSERLPHGYTPTERDLPVISRPGPPPLFRGET